VKQLNLDVAAGQASAASIKGVVADMREVIGRIKTSSVQGLSAWTGAAASSFDATHTDWHAVAVRLEQALGDIENKLTVGFRGYDDEDAVAAATITGSAGADG